MITKSQVRTRHAKAQRNITQKDNEIIEIEEIKNPKKLKSQKLKENAENTSSESTTPNKKGQKKKNNDSTELIEIMDIEIPENESIPPHKKPSGRRQKRSVNKEKENERTKKNEKFSAKSTSKLHTREKSKSPLIKGKKKGKVASITIEESENDSEIRVTSVEKSRTTRNRSLIKSPNNKKNNKSKESAYSRNNKKKNEKKGKKDKNREKNEKEEEIIQCQLSEESDNEDMKKNKSRSKNKKKSKNNENINGCLNNTTIFTRKSQKKLNENKNIKAKSAIKVSLKDENLKEKRNTLLGRKRKAENRNQKSKTPDKKINRFDSLKGKTPAKRTPSQLNKGKIKSKTPVRNAPKKNSKNNKNNLFIPKMEQNSIQNCASPGLAVLNQLIIEYGFEKVLDTLCKPKLEEKYKLDSCLKGLIDSCSDNKLPILLVKMLFSYIESKFDGTKNNEAKRSTSAKKLGTFRNLEKNVNLKKTGSKSSINISAKKSNVPMTDNTGGAVPIEIDDEEIQEIPENNKIEKKTTYPKVSSPKRAKSPLKDQSKKSEKKIMSIGSHYNKTNNGEIYKYQVSKLDGRGNAIFSCYDDKCCGMGLYELETKNFTITRDHTLRHSEHDYIINFDKDGDNVFKDLVASEKNDAQVFKENGERNVKIY